MDISFMTNTIESLFATQVFSHKFIHFMKKMIYGCYFYFKRYIILSQRITIIVLSCIVAVVYYCDQSQIDISIISKTHQSTR